jgi:hypothetical protein
MMRKREELVDTRHKSFNVIEGGAQIPIPHRTLDLLLYNVSGSLSLPISVAPNSGKGDTSKPTNHFSSNSLDAIANNTEGRDPRTHLENRSAGRPTVSERMPADTPKIPQTAE